MARTLTVYIDYKSPYAYLALQPTRDMARSLGLKLDWLPYSLKIENFLGAVDTRNPHQWRRVKYSYMDARRLANERGLIVRGPQKLFDSTIAHTAMLFAKDAGPDVLERFHDIVFEGFFKRELDIEVEADVAKALAGAGAAAGGFAAYLRGAGRDRLDRTLADAEDRLGVFGVPTYVLDGEIFWGGDRLDQVREALIDAEITRITVSRCTGHGRAQRGVGAEELYRGQQVMPDLLAKVRLDIACNDAFVETAQCREHQHRHCGSLRT